MCPEERHLKNHFFVYKTTTKTIRPFLLQGIDLDDVTVFRNYMPHMYISSQNRKFEKLAIGFNRGIYKGVFQEDIT